MQAIKELADRLDGKPAQMLEHSGPAASYGQLVGNLPVTN
jgi:hypothetical protein